MAQEINALLRRLDTIAVRIVLCTHIFFHLESFLWKRPLTVKVRKKKSSIRFWAASVFVLKYVHI